MNNITYLKKYYHGDWNKAIKRLEANEPVQYIVGNVDFYGYQFAVNHDVLIPRFETEELVYHTLILLKKYFSDPKVLDLGTGSGCIGLTIKKEFPTAQLTLTDISSKALEVARKNQCSLEVDCQIITSDLFENINDQYDCIVSNPPYISINDEIDEIVKNNEPHLALYADNDGLFYYEEILKNCEKYLNKSYLMAFEIGSTQKDAIIALINKYLQHVQIITKQDNSGRDRMIFILKNLE